MASNDGGIVLVLLTMMLTLAAELVLAIVLYSTQQKQMARLISGWSNVANAAVHILLTVALYSDTERCLEAGIDDADNFVGPLMLMGINGAIGLRSITTSAGPMAAFGWNTFVAIFGSLVPIVWPKFLDSGISNWPPLIVVTWFGIFAFESLGFFSSCTWYGLEKSEVKVKSS